MAEHKVDIFKVLDSLSRGDKNVWESFTEEEQKSISPLILMRWLSGTSSQRQIVYLNELANHLIFVLAKHPSLLLKVLSCCTDKRPGRFQWIPQKKSSGSKKLSVKVLQEYYNYSSREAMMYLHLVNKDNMVKMAEELGWEKDELTKLKKEL